ncbi:hypothetical protein Tco_0795872 [Tanacetum coccineum]
MLHQRMFESGTYKSLLERITLYEAPEASMARAQRDEFLVEKDKSHKRHHDDQDPPPPPPPDSDLSKRRRHDTGTSGSSLPQAPQSLAWKKSDTQDAPSSSSKQQSGPYAEQPVEDIPIPDSANISDSEDTDSAHLPKIKQMPKRLKPILDDERQPLRPAWGSGQALSISKMKATRYLDFRLELLVPEHVWINEVVRTHMRILSVIRIKAYSRYGYDYLKEITLRRADYQDYTIAEKDFKNLYPSDFEDLNLLLLQGHLNHLSGSHKRMLSIVVNLWTHNLVIRQWVEDFQLGIES